MPSEKSATYRERRLAKFFQNPGQPPKSVLGDKAKGSACQNIRIALRYLGFDLPESDVYDEVAKRNVLEIQRREKHKHQDGLVGPGTRALLVTMLTRKGEQRAFELMTYPNGDPFPRVFVSYASQDRIATEKVVSHLELEGVDLWVDYKNLQPGDQWRFAIEKAIPDCRYFLALISKNALTKKGFIQKEVKIAWAVRDEYPDSAVFVIPARLEDCEVRNSRFADLQWIDLFPRRIDGLKRIVDFLAEAD